MKSITRALDLVSSASPALFLFAQGPRGLLQLGVVAGIGAVTYYVVIPLALRLVHAVATAAFGAVQTAVDSAVELVASLAMVVGVLAATGLVTSHVVGKIREALPAAASGPRQFRLNRGRPAAAEPRAWAAASPRKGAAAAAEERLRGAPAAADDDDGPIMPSVRQPPQQRSRHAREPLGLSRGPAFGFRGDDGPSASSSSMAAWRVGAQQQQQGMSPRHGAAYADAEGRWAGSGAGRPLAYRSPSPRSRRNNFDAAPAAAAGRAGAAGGAPHGGWGAGPFEQGAAVLYRKGTTLLPGKILQARESLISSPFTSLDARALCAANMLCGPLPAHCTESRRAPVRPRARCAGRWCGRCRSRRHTQMSHGCRCRTRAPQRGPGPPRRTW